MYDAQSGTVLKKNQSIVIANISEVDVNKSLLIINGSVDSSSSSTVDATSPFASFSLESNSVKAFNVWHDYAFSMRMVDWQVIEFY